MEASMIVRWKQMKYDGQYEKLEEDEDETTWSDISAADVRNAIANSVVVLFNPVPKF